MKSGFPRLLSLVLLPLAVCGAKPPAADADPALSRPAIGFTGDSAQLPLVPWPMRGTTGTGYTQLDASSRIVARSPELLPLAELLASEILRLTQVQLAVSSGPATPRDIQLRISPRLAFPGDPYLSQDPLLKGLEQRILVQPEGIMAEGTTYQATAMASVTLLQSLQVVDGKLRLPRMKIEDKPGSRYCGNMLDVARQWHPVQTLREVVDLCRLYKVPYFHIHFTDDQGYRLPSLAFPKIPTEGASYSQREMEELVAYADQRGVTIIPEIEVPGHSIALQRAMPEVFGAKNPDTGEYDILGVLNIANEEVYPVLEKLIAETCATFKSSPYLHIGCDETQFGPFFAHPTVKQQLAALKSKGVKTDHIFAEFINRIHAIVKKHGKKTICWEGFGSGEPVDKEIIIMAWHGSSHAPGKLLEAGHEIINVPWTPAVSWSARHNYEWNKWLLNLNEQSQSQQFKEDPRIMGGQMVLWEQGPDSSIPMLRGKLPARHERLYSPWSRRSFEDYRARFRHTDAMLEKLLYPVDVKIGGLINTAENLFHGKPANITLGSPSKDARIYYTLGGKEPTPADGTLYEGPFDIAPSQAGEVYVQGYYGPRAELRVRAFDPGGQPLGGTKWIELRSEAPRISYQLYTAPAGSSIEAVPDVSKLKPLETGKLARFESTAKLRPDPDGPMILTAAGKFEARAAGEYRIKFVGKDARLRIAGKDVPVQPDGSAPVTLDAGLHDISVVQCATDGQVGVVLTMEKAVPDPEANARRFTNEYLHQWMPALPQ